MIPIARSRGVRTINVVRRAELVGELEAIGGDVVLVGDEDLARRVSEATGGAPISLALDCVGGPATQPLLDSLPRYGTLVVYSGMSGKPAAVSNPHLLFQGQSIRGFWIFNWFREPDAAKVAAMYEELASMVASGAISFPVAGRFRFDQHREALALAAKYGGKAILKPNSPG